MLPCIRLAQQVSATWKLLQSVTHFTLMLLANRFTRELFKQKKPAHPNLSSVNRMAHFFSKVFFSQRKHCSNEIYRKTFAGCSQYLRERCSSRLIQLTSRGCYTPSEHYLIKRSSRSLKRFLEKPNAVFQHSVSSLERTKHTLLPCHDCSLSTK